MYKGKDKVEVEDGEVLPHKLVRDPPIKPTCMEIEIMLEKEMTILSNSLSQTQATILCIVCVWNLSRREVT